MCSLINCQVSSELITGVDSLALGGKRNKTRETGIPVVLRWVLYSSSLERPLNSYLNECTWLTCLPLRLTPWRGQERRGGAHPHRAAQLPVLAMALGYWHTHTPPPLPLMTPSHTELHCRKEFSVNSSSFKKTLFKTFTNIPLTNHSFFSQANFDKGTPNTGLREVDSFTELKIQALCFKITWKYWRFSLWCVSVNFIFHKKQIYPYKHISILT